MKSEAFSRSGGIIITIAVHLLVLYIVSMSLGIVKVPNFVKPMEAVIIDQPQEQTKIEPVVTKPNLAEPTLDIQQEIPEIPVEVPVETAPVETVTTAPVESTPPAEVQSLKVTSRVDPIYPAASRRANEEGTVTFRVLVNAGGRATDIQVSQSSGFPKLDQAAADAIRKWKFAAANNGSGAVDAYTTVRVTFRLDNAQ
jgi:protein TonB